MSHRPRSLTDRLLLRAWIEPDHERPLRVLIRRHHERDGSEQEQAFADAEGVSTFVRGWLQGLVRRWEEGEEPHAARSARRGTPPDDGSEEA